MFRYGILTGTIYSDDVEPGAIGECCILCANGADIEIARAKNNECEFCRGCPEYYREEEFEGEESDEMG